MSEPAAVKALIHGTVQGVFFRDFAARHARGLGIRGYVRNLPDGTVEVIAEGQKRAVLEKLIGYLKTGPPRAVVVKVDITWLDNSGGYADFTIRY